MSASPSASGAPPAALARSLKNRHIQMIALGGAIGTGRSAGRLLRLVGPGVVPVLLMAAWRSTLILRFLGEMSTQEPVAAP
ncbi:hypothetical protein [Castellaniella defragrans]|uniref:hypothetical protein n=1 Tax=Castellaniella defragrans TaxID=75697 RepID=UPI002AFFBA7F|nr:hypothetical protein [Castellaniella defragrans]